MSEKQEVEDLEIVYRDRGFSEALRDPGLTPKGSM